MTATSPNPRRATMSTFQMVQDYRLARMFAHIGVALAAREHDGFDMWDAVESLADDLLSLAPEFVPPFDDEEHVPEDWAAWRGLVEEAERG